MLKGFSRTAAPWAGRGSVPIVPGRVCSHVAFARPDLMEAAGKELGEAHEGMERKRGKVSVVRGGGGRERSNVIGGLP